jgi:6-phosphogluconate dehydrogenase (decarboxylating)
MFDPNRADTPALNGRAQRIRRDVIDPFADRMRAALRHAFGGHAVEPA